MNWNGEKIMTNLNKSGIIENSFVRFVIVSLGGVVLNYTLYYIFTRLLTIPLEYLEGKTFPLIGAFKFYHYTLLAEFWAILIVLVYNYLLNKYWSFQERIDQHFIPQFTKYAIVGGSGVIVNLGTLALLQLAGFHDLLALAFALALSIINNYIWNYFWTFRVPEAKNVSKNDKDVSMPLSSPESEMRSPEHSVTGLLE